MSSSEEKINWSQFHERIQHNDPTAFAELCDVALDYIIGYLAKKFPEQGRELYETLAADTLLSYRANPEKYNPNKGGLQTYLCMDADGDIRNEIKKRQREADRIISIDEKDVELGISDRNNEQDEISDWLTEYTYLTKDEILQELANELDEIDTQIVISVAEGIRDTEHYAEILGIQHLSKEEKKAQVKRARDRIDKKLQRFGKRRGSS